MASGSAADVYCVAVGVCDGFLYLGEPFVVGFEVCCSWAGVFDVAVVSFDDFSGLWVCFCVDVFEDFSVGVLFWSHSLVLGVIVFIICY